MKFTYWASTALVAMFALVSAATYLFHKGTIDGVKELGFPPFFRIQLAVLKLVAAIVLIAPAVPRRAKEWAYAGIALFLVTAIVAHTAHNDPLALSLISVVVLIALAVSNVALDRLPSP